MTGVKTVSYTNNPTHWNTKSTMMISVPAKRKPVPAKRKAVLTKTTVTEKIR